MCNNNVTCNITTAAYEHYLLAGWKVIAEFPAAVTKTVPLTLHMVGLLANTTLIIYLIHSRKCRLAIFALLTSLAMCDWLLSLNVIIIALFIHPDVVFILGAKQMCQAILFVGVLSYQASIFHVMALAALRFYQLVHPLQAHVNVTTGRMVKCCYAMWLFGAAVVIYYPINYAVTPVQYNDKTLRICHFVGNVNVKEILRSIFGQEIPLIVIALLHLIKLFKVTKASHISEGENERRSSSSRTVTLLIMCCVICILPTTLHTCYHKVLGYPYRTIHVGLAIYTGMAISANSIVNPFLYLLGSKEIRQDIYKMIRLKVMRKA